MQTLDELRALRSRYCDALYQVQSAGVTDPQQRCHLWLTVHERTGLPPGTPLMDRLAWSYYHGREAGVESLRTALTTLLVLAALALAWKTGTLGILLLAYAFFGEQRYPVGYGYSRPNPFYWRKLLAWLLPPQS
jgi:hypothetical protein